MWFFYEPTRLEVLKSSVINFFTKIIVFFYRIYYLVVILLTLLFYFLFNLLIPIIFLPSALIFIHLLNYKLEGLFNKAIYQQKELSANQVFNAPYYPNTGKSTGRTRLGKDRFNVLYATWKARHLRQKDVIKIRLCKSLLQAFFNLDIINSKLIDPYIAPNFMLISRKKIKTQIMRYLRKTFKVTKQDSFKTFYYDYFDKKLDMFHKSKYVVNDMKYGRHLFEYLVDYVMLFMRLYHKNIYLFSNNPVREDVNFENGTFTPALPFGNNMKKLKSPSKPNVLHPSSAVVLETESGVNNSNLDRSLSKEAYENGMAHFPQLKGHLCEDFHAKKTDQVVNRDQAYDREHDQSNDALTPVKEKLMRPRELKRTKRKKAFRQWCNFWLKTQFNISKLDKKIIELEADFYLVFKVYMSTCGTIKNDKRLWFHKPEDLDKGGYIKVYGYAPKIYSLYNHRYAEFFNGAEEDGPNYFHFEPYQTLDLTNELIELMGLNDLRKKI